MLEGFIDWQQKTQNANHPLLVFGAQHLFEKLEQACLHRRIRLIDGETALKEI